MKKIFRYFLFVLFFVSVLFINVNGVNAVPSTSTETDDGGSSNNGACTYGIICQYQFCGDSSITDCDFNYQTAIVQIAYRCSGSDKTAKSCTTFTAQTGGCKNNGTTSMNISFNVNGIGDRAPIDFTDEVYGEETNTEPINFAGHFKKNGYVCPPLKVSGSGNNYSGNYGGNDSQVFYGKSVGCITNGQQNIDLQGEACKQTDTILEDSLGQQIDDVVDATGTDPNIVDTEAIVNWAQNHGYGNSIQQLGDDCDLINPELKDMLSIGFWIISIVGIILLVTMTAISFIKAIVGSDDEKLKDAFKHLVTRIIVVIILLLLPIILNFIITLINENIEGTVQIGSGDNVFCGVASGSSDSSSDDDSGTAVIDENTGEMTQ